MLLGHIYSNRLSKYYPTLQKMEDREFYEAVLNARISGRLKSEYVRALERLSHEWYPNYKSKSGSKIVYPLKYLAKRSASVSRATSGVDDGSRRSVFAAMAIALSGPEAAPWKALCACETAPETCTAQQWRDKALGDLDDPTKTAQTLLLWVPFMPNDGYQVTLADVPDRARKAAERSLACVPRKYLFQGSGGAFASKNSFMQWANRALRRRDPSLSLAVLRNSATANEA